MRHYQLAIGKTQLFSESTLPVVRVFVFICQFPSQTNALVIADAVAAAAGVRQPRLQIIASNATTVKLAEPRRHWRPPPYATSHPGHAASIQATKSGPNITSCAALRGPLRRFARFNAAFPRQDGSTTPGCLDKFRPSAVLFGSF